jgi:CheY-like chemotaxis protein
LGTKIAMASNGRVVDSGSLDAGQLHVLWIDDQPDEAGLLRFLSLEGFSVKAVRTGGAGLTVARAQKWDLILVDLHLPDLHGLTLIARLRGDGVSCPVVAVTGHYLEPEAPQHAGEAGATAFLYKPLWLDETAEFLRRFGRRHASGAITADPTRDTLDRLPTNRPDTLDRGEMVVARLLARLDGISPAARGGSEDRPSQVVLRALLSALTEPALPLWAVQGCARALLVTLTTPVAGRAGLAAGVRELVREATRRRFAARHPLTSRALDIMLHAPWWWEEGDLAKKVDVSRSHFARTIHQDTGFDFRTLRRIVLMKAAIIDVLSGTEQFAQIAYRRGMQPGTFDSVFRQTFGCCPRELRRLWAHLKS